MHFQFPEAWYLLPLVVLPFLINLQRYWNQETVSVPSLFFLEKILKNHRHKTQLWELLVELLFLLGLIFLLSQPVFSEPKLGQDRLLVLMDNSPSMRYHFISPENSFFKNLEKMLDEKKYEQIDIAFLSELYRKEPYAFRNAKEILKFYQQLPPYLHGSWSAEEVKEFFRSSQVQSQYRNYDFIVYSDNKANHFFNLSDKSLEFPSLINVVLLPSAPVLQQLNLERENLFSRENMELTVKVDIWSEQEIFVMVTVDGDLMFKKQIPSSRETFFQEIKFPMVVDGKEVTDSAKLLTVALEKDGVIFQRNTRVVYVYTPRTLALVPTQHPTADFFKTLLGYDLEKGNLILSPSPESADTLLILDPQVNSKPIDLRSRSMLFFINPSESTVRMNQMLRSWGVVNATVDRKKNVGVLDTLEILPILNLKDKPQSVSAVQVNFKNYFVFNFVKPPNYIVATIQKQPIIFRSANHAIFNGIGLEEMQNDIDPHHLVWIYELLFSFWGKRQVHYVYGSEKESTNRISSLGVLGKRKSGMGLDESTITVTAPPEQEFNTPIQASLWDNVFPKINTFSMSEDTLALNKEILENALVEDREAWFTWEWLDLIILLEIILLGVIIYMFWIRFRPLTS